MSFLHHLSKLAKPVGSLQLSTTCHVTYGLAQPFPDSLQINDTPGIPCPHEHPLMPYFDKMNSQQVLHNLQQ